MKNFNLLEKLQQQDHKTNLAYEAYLKNQTPFNKFRAMTEHEKLKEMCLKEKMCCMCGNQIDPKFNSIRDLGWQVGLECWGCC